MFEFGLPTADRGLDEILENVLQDAAVFYRDWYQKHKPQDVNDGGRLKRLRE